MIKIIQVNFYSEQAKRSERVIKIHRHVFWCSRWSEHEVLDERKKRANPRTSTKHG